MEFPPMTDPEYTQRILARVKLVSVQVIPEYVARTANFSFQEQVGTDMILSLTAEVLRDHVVSEMQTVTLEVPATWWQHLKAGLRDRFGFRWFLKRFPIRWDAWTKDVRFDRYYDYPDSHIALPEDKFGKFIVCETANAGEWNPR